MEKVKIALCGNPNVGKSTVFNNLTGLKQHTGNWTGKTVELASGEFKYKEKEYVIYDLPGTYSLLSHSKEEEVARNFICFEDIDLVVLVCDAVCLERNLNLVMQVLEIRKDVILCVNLMDEAKRKKIDVNLDLLSEMLSVPVVGISAKKRGGVEALLETINKVTNDENNFLEFRMDYPILVEETINKLENLFDNSISLHFKRWLSLKLLDDDFELIEEIIKKYNVNKSKYFKLKQELIECGYPTEVIRDLYATSYSLESERICKEVVKFKNPDYARKNQKVDKILTNKLTGIPIMIFFLFIIFWITIVGANYPSEWLSSLFGKGGTILHDLFETLKIPSVFDSLLIDGVYKVVTWIIAVMLPPMAIFFPLFTILEDLGFLPRIAFNLDNCFRKCKTCGKQSLTMMMGFGCNAAGVTGCRIIDSKRERLVAIITNNFVPCNGRFPTIISILTMFFVGYASYASSFKTALLLLVVILLGVFMTFIVSNVLSKTLLKGYPSSFILELPPYRKPQIGKVLIRSLLDRTLFVLGRALKVAVPAGFIIWLMANIKVDNNSLLSICSSFLNPVGNFMGLDGVILMAFLLGFPANEIIIPIIVMAYMKLGVLTDATDLIQLKSLLVQNGWTIQTALCFIIFMLFHFPCSTTILTIKKETGSLKWTILSFILPTLIGILLCVLIHGLFIIFA